MDKGKAWVEQPKLHRDAIGTSSGEGSKDLSGANKSFHEALVRKDSKSPLDGHVGKGPRVGTHHVLFMLEIFHVKCMHGYIFNIHNSYMSCIISLNNYIYMHNSFKAYLWNYSY